MDICFGEAILSRVVKRAINLEQLLVNILKIAFKYDMVNFLLSIMYSYRELRLNSSNYSTIFQTYQTVAARTVLGDGQYSSVRSRLDLLLPSSLLCAGI